MDELTLRRARKGDSAAFEQLITPLEGLVWRVCWRYTNNTEDARDCLQEAMLKAWRALPDYRGDCALETWMYRITVSCCLDFLRRRKLRAADSADALAEQGFDPADDAPLPEEQAVAADERAMLRQAMAQLPEEMRTALILYALEGRSYEEIAGITSSAMGTVKSRIARARIKLVEMLNLREQTGATCVQSGGRKARK